MKCQTCGYSLWNLPEPRCPECGESFNVEDWTFESGTVRFHCNECDHPLMHRQPGNGPARCSNCNEIIAWSDVRVMPVSERAEEATTRGIRWAGVPLWCQMGDLIVVLLLSGVLVPTLTMRPSPPSLAAHVGFVIVFGLAALLGIAVAPHDTRRKTAVVWLCILWLLSGLSIWSYRDARAKWEQFVAWQAPYQAFGQLYHMTETFIYDAPEPHDWDQFKSWLTSELASADSDPLRVFGLFRLPLIDELKPLPDDDWMRSGEIYVDTRALLRPREESLLGEELVIAFALTDRNRASFVILTNDGWVRRSVGFDWISGQNDLRSRLGLSPLPHLDD